MTQVVKRNKNDRVTRCAKCHSFIIFEDSDTEKESIGGIPREIIHCPECDEKNYLLAWNVLR